MLPTEDSPIIALSSDDEDETESGSELIDVLEDDTSLGGDEDDLDDSDEDEQ